MELRDQIRSDMLSGDKPSVNDLKGLRESYDKCQELLRNYLAKSYGTYGEISDAIKKTAAGTARAMDSYKKETKKHLV